MQLFLLSAFTACTGTVSAVSHFHRNSKRQPAEHKSETVPVGPVFSTVLNFSPYYPLFSDPGGRAV